MKVIKTINYSKGLRNRCSYNKIAKDKAEDFNVNPWAVCEVSVGKDEDPEKYERCVQKVKKKHRKKESSDRNMSKKKK